MRVAVPQQDDPWRLSSIACFGSAPVASDSLPDGPGDGTVPTASVDTVTHLFEDIDADLRRLRDRGRASVPIG
ncbi:hypothetical protein [Embleya scabrispora]|uniref:hypothetical protein n=1 Tax=Embleya scabrispora TaxID=159449 RepID=UPI00035F0039|nr:hypothetical protein [Embleya scabrispora]MYS84167.1 hypothetical protein [Streptomyces sp. SID5474]